MRSEWALKKISDIAVFNPKERLPMGAFAKKIGMDRLQPFTRDVSSYELAKYSGGTKFKNGDTIMARITPCLENGKIVVARGVGGTGDVKLTKERCYLTNLSISADIDENIALPEFVYYYYLPRNLRYLDSGSAQSQITISDLEKVMIPLPSLDEQRAICGYMKMLDRKIEINEEVNENLVA